MSGILWIIIVGFIAGIIARLLSPGPNNPSGFILTTVLGIVGAFLATGRTRAPASSPRPSARWWCCSSGTGWWRAERFPIRVIGDGASRHSGAMRSIEPGMTKTGLLRGACHRGRIRATRWLAMTYLCRSAVARIEHNPGRKASDPGSRFAPSGLQSSRNQMQPRVHAHQFAGHVAGLRRGEKTYQRRDIVCRRSDLERHFRHHHVAHLLGAGLAAALGEPRRIDIAGAYGVDANQRRQRARQRKGDGVERPLARGIRNRRADAADARDR